MNTINRNKKHRNVILVCLFAMILALAATACGTQPPAVEQDPPEEITEVKNEDSSPSDSHINITPQKPDTAQDTDLSLGVDPAQGWESVYEAVIKDEPHSKMLRFFAGTEEYGYVWSFGYYDIDKNGVPELLIALNTLENTFQSDPKGVFIKQIWTVVNDAGVLLLEDFGEGGPEGVYICNDGIVGTQQFSDVDSYKFYKIIEGKSVEEIASLFRGYSNETGEAEYYFHEGPAPAARDDHGDQITKTEYDEKLDKYGSDPDAQNLTEWLLLPAPKAAG